MYVWGLFPSDITNIRVYIVISYIDIGYLSHVNNSYHFRP